MRNDQSTFTKEYGYLIDQFDELQDLRWSDLQYLDEYRELKMKKNDGLPIDQNRLDQLEPIFKNKIVTAPRWNKFQNALLGMQKFIKTEVEGFVLDKQQEINTYTDSKKSEVETTVVNGQNAINTTKDNALISIENKKDNIIDYMDGTTAGQLRNDIGVMGELTTTDKTSLVNAVNEVNAKEVDLTPIEESIDNLAGIGRTTETVKGVADALVKHKAESATIKHKAKEIGLEDLEDSFVSTELEGAMQELFTNVSDGKQMVGGAITDVDDSVVIPTEPTFSDLASAIGSISTGKKWASGGGVVSTDNVFSVRGLSFKPSLAIWYTTNYTKFGFMHSGFNGKYLSIVDLTSGASPQNNNFYDIYKIYDDGFVARMLNMKNVELIWEAFE